MTSKFATLFSVCMALTTLSAGSTCFASDASPDGNGSWTQRTFQNSYGQRNYYVYVPQGLRKGTPVPLMVMLHGCGQSAAVFAQSTRMNTLADQMGFVVLYPEQDKASNSSNCWNWFLRDNAVRGGGELGIITGMVDEVRRMIPIHPRHIGVAGLSAGAALTSNLIACHSDLFSVGILDAGLEYKAASDIREAYVAMTQTPKHDLAATALEGASCTGAGARMAKLLVIQGAADPVVNPKNAPRIIEQFTQMNDLLDDGQKNGSQTSAVIKSEKGQVPGGHAFEVFSYGGNGREQIREVIVDEMPHAWSGGTGGITFSDPAGPSASQMAAQLLFSF
ncbi:MAG: alpha/beta hydrolase family esterase [Bdellovibrionia bacterium]